MTKEELYEIVDRYVAQTYFINDCYCAYFSLIGAIKNYNKEINTSCGFFGVSKFCISKTMFLELAKIFEHSNNEMSLYKLECIIKGNANLLPNKIDDLDVEKKSLFTQYSNFCKENPSLIDNLKSRRDKVLAHNDKEYYLNDSDFLEDFPINEDDLTKLVNFLNNYIFSVACFVQDKRYILTSTNSNDLVKLMEIARKVL